ncbi:MAG: 3-phosphoglycerate dehydrogenase, partial [Acidimicrobiia bacterium]
MADRPKALVTAPFRGEGLDTLRDLADVVLDPWIDQRPLRLYSSDQLAERIDAEDADLVIVETDSVKGPVLERPLLAIGSCRGDPDNVDVEAATA